MTIIISTGINALETAISHEFIAKGITLINLKTLDEVYNSVGIISDICFIDEKMHNSDFLKKTISDIKKNEEKKQSKIILLTECSDIETMQKYAKMGVDGLLQSSLHTDTIAKKLLTFVENIQKRQNERRKYIRIQPEPDEDCSIKFIPLDENKYIEGKITDISMSGVAVKILVGPFESIKENTIYPRCQLKINKKHIFTNLKVVRVVGNSFAFIYEKLHEEYRNILTEYIYQKVQNYFNENQ